MIFSIFFATNWYKESIKSKSELRQDILNEIAGEGKRIIDEKEIKILKENTEIMQLWMKNNHKYLFVFKCLLFHSNGMYLFEISNNFNLK